MNEANFSSLDLNLLRLFDVLIQERSVTRAARRLGLTQSAVSHALNRLRATLSDELFVRTPEGMQPSPWATSVAPRIRRALEEIEEAICLESFDPATSGRSFTIAASSYVCALLAPELFARFRREAPTAELQIRPVGSDLSAALDTGLTDLVIGGFGRVPDRYSRESLLTDRMVWALSTTHPLAARDDLQPEALAALPRLIIVTAQGGDGDYQSEGGLERRVVWDGTVVPPKGSSGPEPPSFAVHDAATAMAVAARTDIVALVPRRLAAPMEAAGRLRLYDPVEPATPAENAMVYRKDHGGRPAQVWLRALVRAAAQAA